MGMIVGIEIVVDKESRKPAPEAADLLAFKYDISVVFISSPIEERHLYLRLPIYLACERSIIAIMEFFLPLSRRQENPQKCIRSC